MRATQAEQWAAGRAAVHRPQVAGSWAAEQVAWQRLHTVAAWGSGTAAYRAALHAWRTARYDLDRALVPPPQPRRRRPGAHHSGSLPGARSAAPG